MNLNPNTYGVGVFEQTQCRRGWEWEFSDSSMSETHGALCLGRLSVWPSGGVESWILSPLASPKIRYTVQQSP